MYKVSHADTGRISALKRVNDEKYTTNFAKEISMLSMLDHPNIVSLEYSDPFSRYYVMSYIEGDTLEKKVELNKKSDYKKLGYMFSQLLDGVAHMHEQKVLHLDIKPQNIMYDKKIGKFYLVDFGIARRIHKNTESKEGSIYFSSPEMILGETVDQQSDIYSLGATLYYVLTQKYLYDEEEGNIIEVIADLYRQPVIPRKYNKSIPPSLEAICLKACQKQKKRRYIGSNEFIKDLDVFYRGGTPEIPHKIYSLQDKAMRHRYKLASLGVAGMLSIVGYGISIIKSTQLKEELNLIQSQVKLAKTLENQISEERDKAKLLDDYLMFIVANYRGGDHELTKNKQQLDSFFERVGQKNIKDEQYYIEYLKALNYNLNNQIHTSVDQHKSNMNNIVKLFSNKEKSESTALELFKYTGYLDLEDRSQVLQKSTTKVSELYAVVQKIIRLQQGEHDIQTFNSIIDDIQQLNERQFRDIRSELHSVLFGYMLREVEANLYERTHKLLNEKEDYRVKILAMFNGEIENIGIDMTKRGIPVTYYIGHRKKIKSKQGKITERLFAEYMHNFFRVYAAVQYDTNAFKDAYKVYYEINQFYKKTEEQLVEDRLNVLYPIITAMTLSYGKFEEFFVKSSSAIDKQNYGTHVYRVDEMPKLLFTKQFELKRSIENLIKEEVPLYPYSNILFPGSYANPYELIQEIYANLNKLPLNIQEGAFFMMTKPYSQYIISEYVALDHKSLNVPDLNQKIAIKDILKKYQPIHKNYNFINSGKISEKDIKKYSRYMNLVRDFHLKNKDDSFAKELYEVFYNESNVMRYIKNSYEHAMYSYEAEMIYLLLLDKFKNNKYLSSTTDIYLRNKFSNPYSYEKKQDDYYFIASLNLYKISNLTEQYLNNKKKVEVDSSWEKLWNKYFYEGSLMPKAIILEKGYATEHGFADKLIHKQKNILRMKYGYYYMLDYIVKANNSVLNESARKEYDEVLKLIEDYVHHFEDFQYLGNLLVERIRK